jgi:hypothetical protein
MNTIEAMKLALGYMDGTLVTDHLTGYERKRFVMEALRQAIEQAEQVQPVANGKLKVTLQDTPTEIALAQYKRMFEAACSALGAIGEELGVDEDEGGAEPILAAIAELKASPPPRQPLTDGLIDGLCYATEMPDNSLKDIGATQWLRMFRVVARAIEAAHGIKGEA